MAVNADMVVGLAFILAISLIPVVIAVLRGIESDGQWGANEHGRCNEHGRSLRYITDPATWRPTIICSRCDAAPDLWTRP